MASIDDDTVDIYLLKRDDGPLHISPWFSCYEGEVEELRGKDKKVQYTEEEKGWKDKSGTTYIPLRC